LARVKIDEPKARVPGLGSSDLRRVLRPLYWRAKGIVRPFRNGAQDLLPVRMTANRTPAGQVPLPPDSFASFGEGSWVVPPARILGVEHLSLGEQVVIMEHSTLWALSGDPAQRGPRIVIGDGVRLARFNTIICTVGVILGAAVSSSDSVTILDTWEHPYRPAAARSAVTPPPPAPVVIEAGAYLGCNSTICPGVRVGEGAFVGEGAVVVEDVPAHSVVYGNPATVTRRYEPSAGAWEGQRWP
jgi:acetyltransferase-like isoleucine patch superfamily enzyme